MTTTCAWETALPSPAGYAAQAEQQTGVFVGRNLEAREAKISARLMKELI